LVIIVGLGGWIEVLLTVASILYIDSSKSFSCPSLLSPTYHSPSSFWQASQDSPFLLLFLFSIPYFLSQGFPFLSSALLSLLQIHPKKIVIQNNYFENLLAPV
jgi:hypothetical protein